jgi:hypothetical protein
MAQSLQGNLTKKAHQRVKFTEEQIVELNKCMDPKNGPLYFMTQYSMIQHPTKGSKFARLSEGRCLFIQQEHTRI